MTAYPAWTPASRPGIVPLHPLSFGTILGRSFAALRQNPRVLLGFALVVQSVSYLAVLGVGALTFFSAQARLQTVPVGSEEYQQIAAGSYAIVFVSIFVLGLAAGALGVIVQAVVVTDVAYAVVAERLRLGQIWRRVRPVAWRLIGYAALLSLAMVVGAGLVALLVVALSTVSPVAGIAVAVFAVLGAFVVVLWLATKLILVPATIILEHATIRRAIARSWHLTRRRFWSTLGIVVVVQVIFSVIAQVVSIPFSILGALLSSVLAPTGNEPVTGGVGFIVTLVASYVVSILVQSVGLVVQSTASGLIYVDCRMRHEGLDLDLLSYVERRDAGEQGLPDPYEQGVGRTFVRPGPPMPFPPPSAGQPYPAQPYPGQPYAGQPSPGQPYAGQPYPGQPGYAPGAPAAYPPQPPQDAAPPAPPYPAPTYPAPPQPPAQTTQDSPAATPSPTTWAAPGAPADREAP